MKSILVTGGLGFIGSAFVRRAILQGYKVLIYDSVTYAADMNNVSEVCLSDDYNFIKGDIRDAKLIKRCLHDFQPDQVINFAAETHVDRSIQSPATFVETNVLGTASLIQACNEYWISKNYPENFRFCHVSTDEIFGSIAEPHKSTESDAYRPNSPYSASKASSNHLVRAFHKTYGFPSIVTNGSNTYGPNQHIEKLIPMVIGNALNQKPIKIYGDGKNVRDWLFVDDHVEALFAVMDCGKIGSEYNIGANCELTNNEIVRMICDILSSEQSKNEDYHNLVVYVPDRPGHDQRYALNTSRINFELCWTPRTTIENGLIKTIRSYAGNISGP